MSAPQSAPKSTPKSAAQAEPQPAPTPPVDLRTVYPLIVTPSHDGKLFENYTLSLLNLVAQAAEVGLRVQVLIASGESLITRARNNAVAYFLANPQFTHLFWIDADIGFSIDSALRLLTSGHDVCAGVYPLKTENWPEGGVPEGTDRQAFDTLFTRYTVNTAAKGKGRAKTVELAVRPDGFIALDEAPTGFMLIARGVFDRMVEAYPDLRYVPDTPGVQDQGLHYRFFDCMVAPESGRYLSEDYAFCRRWSALGGSVHVDAGSNLSHRGHKTYRGDFARSLVAAMPFAVGAPVGAKMRLTGGQHLRSNPAGPA